MPRRTRPSSGSWCTSAARSWSRCSAFVFIWYFGFIALAGYAPDFMGERLIDGFTVGYLLALSQFVMTWVLGWLYLRQATGSSIRSPSAPRSARSSSVATPRHGADGATGDGDDAGR